MSDSPFVTNARKPLTEQQKARLFLERGGVCHRCKRKLGSGDKWTDEHVRALQNGGTNDWDNRDITCSWCFVPKNAEDAGIAAKARRVRTKHVVPTGTKRKGRGFRGWRKFNGDLVWVKEGKE